MALLHHFPPVIRQLPPHPEQPLWSVMIPAYNCALYLPQTLESVLLQHIPENEMQIEVVDDASTDTDVEALVTQIGKGRIKYYRQLENVGSLRNFETCINRAKGKLVHLLHGDDLVRPGYYRQIENLFRLYPEAGAAFSRYRYINEHGHTLHDKIPEMAQAGILQNWLALIGECQRIQYAAITVRREVYEKLGAFNGPTYGEDWEMWVRIARDYPVAYTPEILAEYRMHSNSLSGTKYLTGEYLQDLLTTIGLIQQHLPEKDKPVIQARSRKLYASYGLKIANKLWKKLHNRQVVEAQIRNALHLHKSPKLYLMIALLYLKMVINKG